MIYTLTGTNTYAIDERANSLAETAASNVQISKLDAEGMSASELIQQLSSISLFTPEQAFVVNGLSEIGEDAPNVVEALAQTDTLIIFVEPKLDKRTKLFKLLQKATAFENYDALAEPQLVDWLVKLAAKEQGQLTPALARQLIERSGTDQHRLRNELIKLIDYDPEVTATSIEYLVARSPREDVFALLDATIQKNTSRAYEIYDDLREQQLDPHYVLSMIVWQLTSLAQIKSTQSQTPDEAARTAGMSPYVIKKQRPIVERLSLAQLKNMVSATVNTDMALKTSKATPDTLVKSLITTLSR